MDSVKALTQNGLDDINNYKLTEEEFNTWAKLTKKVQLEYKYHTEALNKLLPVIEALAIDCDYI